MPSIKRHTTEQNLTTLMLREKAIIKINSEKF
jgi:hypothetical protein